MADVVGSVDVLEQLSDRNPLTRAAGLTALQDRSEAEMQNAIVATLVSDPHYMVRQAAVGVFQKLGAKGAEQLSSVSPRLSDADPGVVAAAACVLAAMGTAAASQASVLESLLARRDEDTTSVPLTVAGVAHKVPATLRKPACAAATALAAINPSTSNVAPKIAECLKDSDSEVRAAAAAALGRLGKACATYEGQLLELLNDSNPSVVVAACDALGMLATADCGAESCANAMADLLTSDHVRVRAAAAKALGCMGEEIKHHLGALVKRFSDSPSVKAEAMKAVGKAGPSGQMFAPNIARLTYDSHPWVRAEACEVLAGMGHRGACFAEEVRRLLDDEDWDVWEAATRALSAFETAAADAAAADAPRAMLLQGDEPPHITSTASAALLFPGQGSQYMGMLSEAKSLPAVEDMLQKAKSILGFDLLDLCLNGPEDKLERTEFCQPAMYVAGLAAIEMLRRDQPGAVSRIRAVAGLSLGEYTALTFAGVLDFQTGLELVKIRAEAMQAATEISPQAMASVAGISQEALQRLCDESVGPGETCKVANYLWSNGFTCAGSLDAIDKLVEKASGTAGVLQAKKIKTSGAFHTELMKPAQERLMAAMKDFESKMQPPQCDVWLNVSGKKIAAGTPPSELIPMLVDQLCSCVLWEPCVRGMIADGVDEFFECGPNKQLKAMMKRIDADAHSKTSNVPV